MLTSIFNKFAIFFVYLHMQNDLTNGFKGTLEHLSLDSIPSVQVQKHI